MSDEDDGKRGAGAVESKLVERHFTEELQSSEPDRVTDLPVLSAVQAEAERAEVREGVQKLLEKQQQGILKTVSRLLIFGALPVMAAMTVRQVYLGLTSVWFWVQLGSIGLAVFGTTTERLAVPARGLLCTASFCVTAMMALVHFGPSLGVSIAFITALLFAALLLKASHAYIATAFLVLAIDLSALSVALGYDFLTPSELEVSLPQWSRIAATCTVGLFALLFVFLKVQSNLWDSLADQIGLRIREKKFVEEREKMVRTAGSVQRLESLGRLAGGIAHDFNNSLVVIQCGLGALEEDLEPTERQEVLDEVNDGVARAAGTARQLLSFAKRNVGELGSCDARLVGERVQRDASRLLQVNLKLELHLPDSGNVPAVALSEATVEQLILILVQNSQEAMGDQAGTITLSLAEDPRSGGLRLELADDGPGMPSDVLQRVWEPFFTTKGEGHNGLGLSTAWATVRRHGGEVTIASSGRGTTVTMAFPAAPELTSAPRVVAAVPVKRSEMTVLILEDEAPIRTALRRILKQIGLKVEEADSVAVARDLLKQRDFSLLISDGVLPDGGAGAFIQDFRRQQKAPVILCSGYLEEELALEGVSRGTCSFLPKPFTAEELSELVRSVLSGSTESS